MISPVARLRYSPLDPVNGDFNLCIFCCRVSDKPIKQGWLKKPSPMRGWQKRWFVLTSSKLVYYNNEDISSRVHGSIDLHTDKWVTSQASSDTEKFVFEITTGIDNKS